MASIKIHVFKGSDGGTVACDYRGDKRIGSQQGDEHRTIAELDPATQQMVDAVLEHGPAINAILSKLVPTGLPMLGKVALRIGVWDE